MIETADGFYLVKGIFSLELTRCDELTMLSETARFQHLNTPTPTKYGMNV
jgi:hypothetical protein